MTHIIYVPICLGKTGDIAGSNFNRARKNNPPKIPQKNWNTGEQTGDHPNIDSAETCILQFVPDNDIHQWLGNIYLPQLNVGLSSQALNKVRFLCFKLQQTENEEIPQST